MAINLTPDGLNSTVSGEMPNYPIVYSRVGGTTSYLDVNGNTNYTSPAIRICTLGLNESYVRGRVIKTGDINYSDQISDFYFMAHIWGQTNNRYGLRVTASNFNNKPSYWWVNSSRELWMWQTDLWSQYGRVIFEAASNVDFTGASDSNMAPANAQTKAWTGQTRNYCDSSTTISIEDVFGSPV